MGENQDPGQPEKKIDLGWKEEVRRERERLHREAEQQRQHQVLPEATFSTLVSGFVSQTLMALGELENPFTRQKELDLGGARYSIDVLGILQEKTRGNLTEEEKNYLQTVLSQLRLLWVRKSSPRGGSSPAKPSAPAEGTAPPPGA